MTMCSETVPDARFIAAGCRETGRTAQHRLGPETAKPFGHSFLHFVSPAAVFFDRRSL